MVAAVLVLAFLIWPFYVLYNHGAARAALTTNIAACSLLNQTQCINGSDCMCGWFAKTNAYGVGICVPALYYAPERPTTNCTSWQGPMVPPPALSPLCTQSDYSWSWLVSAGLSVLAVPVLLLLLVLFQVLNQYVVQPLRRCCGCGGGGGAATTTNIQGYEAI